MLAMRALIEQARWQGDCDACWSALEQVVPADDQRLTSSRERDILAGAHTGLAYWHLDRDRVDAAVTWLDRADAVIEATGSSMAKRAVEVGWLRARIAVLRSDHVAAAAAADRVLAARPTWFGQRRAADCLHLAFCCAATDPAAAALAASYRDRAAALYGEVLKELHEDVAQAPDDPWYVLPWGFAGVRAAELAVAAGHSEQALPLLDAALPRLLAVRAAALADLWDEALFRDGQALQARLTAGARR
jgi:hypothetical protein